MPSRRVVAALVPAVVGLILLLWGVWVLYTAFRYGTLPVAGWETERKRWFGLTWFIAFYIVLLPAYLYTISYGLQRYRHPEAVVMASPRVRWLAPLGIAGLLLLLTFSTRVAVTAWFPSAMHPPFGGWQGGVVPGIAATIVLLLLEAGVLKVIKHQKQTRSNPTPLLLPAFFAVILLAWAIWIIYTGFTEGSLPVVGWGTDHDVAFGLAWLVIFIVVLLPAYLYAIGLGVLGVLERGMENQSHPQNYWLLAITQIAMLSLVTFCARVAVTAWFPEPLQMPLGHFHGGVLVGALTTAILLLVTLSYYKLARSF